MRRSRICNTTDGRMPETRNYLNFEIIKESWNVYNLYDGSTLKTRNMLRSAWYVQDGAGRRRYSADIKNDTVLMCESSLQGPRNQTKFTNEQIQENIEVEDCRYDTLSYEPEEYMLDGNVKILIHSNITNFKNKAFRLQRGQDILGGHKYFVYGYSAKTVGKKSIELYNHRAVFIN